MHDVLEFLHRHPPFDDLEESALEEISRSVEVEFFPSGETIFKKDEGPISHLRVIRRGAVELVDHSRVLDVLGEGETFGHPSMLSGQPSSFGARAGEDSLCYRLPADSVMPLFSRPAGLRFVARTLLDRTRAGLGAPLPAIDPGRQPVGGIARPEPGICNPETSLREAAGMMSRAGEGSILIRLGEGRLGIVTDGDLRRVTAEGIAVDVPVSEVMTTPVFSVGPERLAADVMLEMLERGIHHVPVVEAAGGVVGILSPIDILAAQTHSPFLLRRRIDDSPGFEELREVASRLRPTVVALHDERVATSQIEAIIAIVIDALTKRTVELVQEEAGPAPAPFTWLALGSDGRREPVPSSDVDSALLWEGEGTDDATDDYMGLLGSRVMDELATMGLPADSHTVSAANPLFRRSAGSWRQFIRGMIEDPERDKALIVISLLCDSRPIHGPASAGDVREEFSVVERRTALQRLMLQEVLVNRPPSGFMRGIVVEHSGKHAGRLDIKHGGVLPVTSIARYASLAAGADATSTRERLRSAAAAGILEEPAARTLEEAFDLFSDLRLEHQVEQLRSGLDPDNHIDPEQLNPLTRRYLRDAFTAVRTVQRQLAHRLSGEQTFG